MAVFNLKRYGQIPYNLMDSLLKHPLLLRGGCFIVKRVHFNNLLVAGYCFLVFFNNVWDYATLKGTWVLLIYRDL